MPDALPYKIAVLVFLENAAGEHLLLHRAKSPNKGAWSPIGGKLETALGESPFECAVRETREETGFRIAPAELHLFAMIAEKAYEGETHWLMFLFRCRKPVSALPPDISEGRFGFFTRGAIEALRESGRRVPEDVAVVGFDNRIVVTHGSRPEITSIDMQLEELGRLAARRLFAAIDGKGRPGSESVSCRLVIRGSTTLLA